MRRNGAISSLLLVAGLGFSIAGSALAQNTGGYALSFDGVDDLVTVSNNPLLELTSGTIELWVKPDWAPGSLGYDPVLVANQLGPALIRYSIRLDRNLAGIMLANGATVATVPYPFTRGAWVHVAVVAGASTAQVYVNGLLVGATNSGFGTLIGLPLNLGSDGTGGFFQGEMDEVRIWNVLRSATDIRYNVSRALAGNESGLIAYWRLDEGIGTKANDATAKGLDGTLNGPAWTNSDVVLVNTTGSFGLALDFSASRSTYVQVPTASSLMFTNQLTFEAWIKPRSAQCNTILSRGSGSNLASTDYIFQVGTDGTNCGVMKLALMVANNWTVSASAVPLNAWTHVAATYDRAMTRFYINGLLDSAVPATSAVSQSLSPLFIGRQGSVGGNYFDGTLDEVRVWNTVRNASQIQTNLSRRLSVNEPGLVGYWRFDEQSGFQSFDSSGRGNHGQIINRPVHVPSFWAPVLTLNGANPLPLECHVSFTDPGAAITCIPVAVAAGNGSAFALRPDGSAVGWGFNGSGQINLPPTATNLVALSVGQCHSLALKADGSVLGMGDNTFGEVSIPSSATNIVGVATSCDGSSPCSGSQSSSLALKSDGNVIGWGSDAYHQLEIPPSATNIVAIAASAAGAHCLALRADEGVVQWGSGAAGTIVVNGVIAVAAGYIFDLGLKPDGTVGGWGDNSFGQTAVPVGLNNVVAIAAGYQHSLALRSDGTVVAWGFQTAAGQWNGPPASATNVVAIAAGGDFSVALKADGSVIAWGRDSGGDTLVPPNVNSPALPLTTRGAVGSGTPGHYSLTYSAANSAGGVGITSRDVLVADTTPPILTLLGANPLNVDIGTAFVDPGAIATDACAGNLTGNIVSTGTVNTALPSSYTVTYTVSDPSGNTATNTRTVLVRGPPSILGFNAFFSGTNIVTGSPVVQFLAEVNPNGLPTVTFAQYGLNTAYPGRTTAVSLPASYNPSSFFATLDGLIPGATYHFRVAATNQFGVTYGPDETFTVPLVFRLGDLNGDGQISESELLSVVSNNFSTATQGLTMGNPMALGHGLFQFGLTNDTGWNFTVLASTNLTDWVPLPVTAKPVWQFLDPAATNQPHRFYKIRSP